MYYIIFSASDYHDKDLITILLPTTSSLIVFLGFLCLPESPIYLCHKKEYQEAKNVLNKLYDNEQNDVESQLNYRISHVADSGLEISTNDGKTANSLTQVLNFEDVFGYGSASFFVPLYILTVFQQLMGGFPLFFYVIKIFKTVGEFITFSILLIVLK